MKDTNSPEVEFVAADNTKYKTKMSGCSIKLIIRELRLSAGLVGSLSEDERNRPRLTYSRLSGMASLDGNTLGVAGSPKSIATELAIDIEICNELTQGPIWVEKGFDGWPAILGAYKKDDGPWWYKKDDRPLLWYASTFIGEEFFEEIFIRYHEKKLFALNLMLCVDMLIRESDTGWPEPPRNFFLPHKYGDQNDAIAVYGDVESISIVEPPVMIPSLDLKGADKQIADAFEQISALRRHIQALEQRLQDTGRPVA
jgi:hypothetical protein